MYTWITVALAVSVTLSTIEITGIFISHYSHFWISKYCFITILKLWDRDFPGGTVLKNLPASAGDMGSIPDLGGFHMSQSNETRAPQLLSLRSRTREPQLLRSRATTTEACSPRACAPQREATSMRSPRTATKSSPHYPQLEKPCTQQRRPNTAKTIN